MRVVISHEGVMLQEAKEFVNSFPNSTVYHDPRFVLANKNLLRPIQVIVLNDNNAILAHASGYIFSEEKGVIKHLTNRTIFKGDILFQDAKVLEILLKNINKYLDRKVVYTKISCSKDLHNAKGYYNKYGYKWEPHLNFWINLSQGEEEVWNKISKTRRKQIKRGYNRGLTAQVVTNIMDFDPYYELLKITYRNAGLPLIEKKYFANIVDTFSKSKQIVVVRVSFDEQLVAHRIVLTHERKLHDWYAGSNPLFHQYYCNDVAVWEILKWGCEHGYNFFDFGGAGHPDIPYGVREFKKKFGGELVNYGILTRVNAPYRKRILEFGIRMKNYWEKLK